jgi:AraC-like DNA-binding protein
MRSVLTEVDTRAVVPAERFEYWLGTFSQAVIPLRVRSEHVADFAAQMRMLDLGVVRVILHRYPSLEVHRTPGLIRRADPGLYQLVLNIQGEIAVVQSGRTACLSANEFTFVDCSQPFRATHSTCRSCSGQPEAITVPVAHALLPIRPELVTELHAMRMSGRHGVGVLLNQYLRELTRQPERYELNDVARLGTITLDLVVATLAHHLDTDVAADLAQEQAMLARVREFVERRIADPELSPTMIAEGNHVSIRTLHRLFRADGTTVGRWIRARRLELCRRDLVDSLRRTSSIRAIAARWGFPDAAHFSRAFRAEYGMSPRSFRERLRGSADPTLTRIGQDVAPTGHAERVGADDR